MEIKLEEEQYISPIELNDHFQNLSLQCCHNIFKNYKELDLNIPHVENINVRTSPAVHSIKQSLKLGMHKNCTLKQIKAKVLTSYKYSPRRMLLSLEKRWLKNCLNLHMQMTDITPKLLSWLFSQNL